MKKLNLSGGSFLMLSIAFHLLLIGGACVWVVQSNQIQRKLNFSGGTKPSASAPEVSHEYKVQADRRNQAAAPLSPTRISTSSENAKISIPDVALATPQSAGLPSLSMGGMAGSAEGMFAASGRGSGSAMGSERAGMPTAGVTLFGFKGAGTMKGMTGRLYDLMQKKDKAPTEIALTMNMALRSESALGLVKKFESKAFDASVLDAFFIAPDELTASRFWIPSLPAETITKSFNVEKDVKPSMLIIHYKAKIMPPREGTYRFVGFGDDFIGIKCDGKVILPFDRKGSRVYLRGERAGVFYEANKKGHAVSDPVKLGKNQVCELEIVLSKLRGGLAGFSLLVEREEDLQKYKRTAEGLPILPIFETDILSPVPEPVDKPGFPTILPERDAARLAWKVIKS